MGHEHGFLAAQNSDNAASTGWRPPGWAWGLLLVVVLAGFVTLVGRVLVPVMMGGLFAVMLHPLLPHMQRRLGRFKSLSVSIVLVAVVLFMLAPVAFVVVIAIRTIKHLASGQFGELRQTIGESVKEQVERLAGLAQSCGVQVNTQELRANATDLAQEVIGKSASQVGDIAALAPTAVFSLFLLLFALYFFLRDGKEFMRWLASALPYSHEETDKLFASVQQAIYGVVLSSMLVSLLQSALCLIAMLIFGIPGAFVWSVIAFALSFLPMIGTTPVTLGCVVYLAFAHRLWASAVMAVVAVFIGTVDNFVRPLVQGTKSKLHPLLTLLSIFGGLETLGAAGIFLGPPMAAIALWAIETYVAARRTQPEPTVG